MSSLSPRECVHTNFKLWLVSGFLLLALSGCGPFRQVNPPPAKVPRSDTPAQMGATHTPIPSTTDTTTPTASEAPLPPPLPVVSSPALLQIDFQDANNGWGIAFNNSGYILRTVDGGATWLDATPSGAGSIGYSARLTALNTNTVWVLVPEADFFTGMLYRTTDGGVTWTSNPVPFGGATFQFLDVNTGRALADRGASAGSQAVELYQTADGGATWVSVFHNDPTQPDSSDSLPLGGIKNGMTFLDANTGWVTGSRPMDGDVYLFVTHNGGVSWSQQTVPLPAGYEIYRYMPQAPAFFGNGGFLPLIIFLPDATEFIFYTTHDGGATWSGDPSDANRLVTPGHYAMADALHIWSWDGGANLYYSTDGAQTWGRMAASLDLSGRLSELDFVPSTTERFTGWALTSVDDSGHAQLYRTTDSGATWTSLIQ